MSKVLIVSSKGDAHSRVVAWSLESRGHEVVYWDTSSAIQRRGFSIEQRQGQQASIRIEGEAEFDSCWLRRVFHPRSFELKTDPDDRKYIRNENGRYVDNLFERMSRDGTRWLNNKISAIQGELKVEQLQACADLGVRFPSTLISNDPALIRAFVEEHGLVALKPIDVFTWNLDDGSRLMTYASKLSFEDLAGVSDEELLSCPAIYQELIHKAADIRVVCIEDDVYACEIINKNVDCIDFRPFQTDGTLVYRPYDVPEDMRNAIIGLRRHFGLQMVSSDFCVDPDGEFYFLDLNPGGAFLFVEYYGGGDIVARVAALLGGGNPSEYPGLLDYNGQAERCDVISGA